MRHSLFVYETGRIFCIQRLTDDERAYHIEQKMIGGLHAIYCNI